MLLDHHAVPFATGHLLVVLLLELAVALEGALRTVGPFVGFGIPLGGEFEVHRLTVIHVINGGHRLHGEEHELAVGVLIFLRHREVLTESVGLQAGVVVSRLFPFPGLEIVGRSVEHLGGATPVVFRVEVDDACRFRSLLLAELLLAEGAGVGEDVAVVILLRVPGHLQEEVDGIFHRLEVAHVEHPEFVYSVVGGEFQLLPHSLNRGDVKPLGVAWRAHVVHVVIHSPAAGVLALLGVGQSAHVAPVVVAEKDDHVVGHAQTRVVVVEHLLVERPHLRCLGGGLAGLLGYDFSLVFDDFLEELHIGFGAHGLVAIAAHTDRDDILSPFHALDSLGEETVEVLLVGVVVPCTILFAVTGVFLMVAGHRLVVACAHDHAHLVGRGAVLRVVGIERPAPHRGPEIVAAQTQDKLAHVFVELMPSEVGAVMVFHPCGETRGLVVEEDAAVFHSGFPCGVAAAFYGEVVGLTGGYVGPEIPGGDAKLLGKFVDAVDCAAAVTSGYHEGLTHARQRILYCRHQVFLPFPRQLIEVEFPGLGDSLNRGALQTADDDNPVAFRLREYFCGFAGSATEIFGEVAYGDGDPFLVGRIIIEGKRLAVFNQRQRVGRQLRGGDPLVVFCHKGSRRHKQ